MDVPVVTVARDVIVVAAPSGARVVLTGAARGFMTAGRPAPVGVGKRQRSTYPRSDQARKHQTGRGGDAQPRTHVVTTLSRTALWLK
ncbi:hypothetical protein A5699_20350 [Mycobacterium sp. E802]|nr:hypothetical protein A5699_20350 [Mycobacterium sp. E802]